jgi:hypothetical protein
MNRIENVKDFILARSISLHETTSTIVDKNKRAGGRWLLLPLAHCAPQMLICN